MYFCSVSMSWPTVNRNGSYNKKSEGKIPAIIRIASRGDCTSQKNDISAMEMYQVFLIIIISY